MNPSPRFPRTARPRRGMALLVVLSSLLLLTILVIGLLVRAGTESRSSSHYIANTSVRKLTDTVVNIVQAQINHATSQGANPASPKAWASQPGAIRLFNADGSLSLVYKLYSSDTLTTPDAATLANDVPAAAWATQPATWVDVNAPATATESDGTSRTFFPVLDPRDPSNLNATATIEGFALASPPGATAAQPAPMPVRWMYVLQDGTMVAPAAGGTSRTVTVAGASKANPIVGRVAFWTDDETCKVNINTAGDGTFWDTPHYYTPDESNRAMYQPAKGEFQAYPGHPATTTLQKVFGGLHTPALTGSQLFSLTPRYTYGGSQGGTQAAAAAIAPKSSRLFSSIGELLFDPARNPAGLLTPQQLETGRFFLTAHSSAPEVTLFGTPRIAVWPLHATNDAAHRTAIDKLIAFCSTINGNPYYFTRSNPFSPTADVGLARNGALLGYLDRLAAAAVPGFGGTFSGKYGTQGIRQILTEMFDYVRITNLNDPTVSSPYLSASSSFAAGGGVGVVAPTLYGAWGTRGFGRFPVLSEASLFFMAMGHGAPGPVAVGAAQTPGYAPGTPPANTTAVQGFFFLTFFNPAHGFSTINPGFTVVVTGLDGLKLNALPMGMPASATESITNLNTLGLLNDAVPFAAVFDCRALVVNRQLGTAAGQNPFYSSILEVPTGGSMALGAASLTVSLYAGNTATPANLIQSYPLNFPGVTMPAPGYNPAAATLRLFGSVGGNSTNDRAFFLANGAWRTGFIDPSYDSIVSMVPAAGWSDYRLFSVVPAIPASAFVLHPSAGGRTAFCYRSEKGSQFPNTTTAMFATVLPGVAPSTFNSLPQTVPPDWDNGVGSYAPGSYINKADEGTALGIGAGAANIPYITQNYAAQANSSTFFSANRQIPSPAMFGSLSTGTTATPPAPWQTLLFRPGPGNHPGEASPPDHLLLDLFWMPAVEPYAISEPFATAGKINLNYQIEPFTYITRNTALRSALAPEQAGVINSANAAAACSPAGSSATARVPLNLSDTDGTLRQFKEKFAANDLFKSASEICSIFLVPNTQSWSSDAAARTAWYGSAFAGVGDNVRERPYADLYSRLTTKSNCFKVFYTVQVLQNPPANPPATWNEDTGVVLGEQRGSATVERYIDPTETTLPDYASAPAAPSLETFYRWRIVESDAFTR